MNRLAALVVTAALMALPASAHAAEPQPTPAPTTADGYTQMFADKQDTTWSGGDQMTSYRASNGAVYWITGDVMLSHGEDADGSYPDGAVMVSNRILRQHGTSLVDAVVGDGNAIPDPAGHTEANGDRYWPQALFEANGFVYVICQRVQHDGTGGFALKGAEIAKFAFSGRDLVFRGVHPTPSETVLDQHAIQWAGSAEVVGGFVYVFGFRTHESDPYAPHRSYVARVPATAVESPAAWRFWNGTTWGTTETPAESAAILHSQVSSVEVIGGMWRILHKPWNGNGVDVYLASSYFAEGPYGGQVIFQSPAGTTPDGHRYQTYTPQFHPWASLTSGRVLVSMDWNGMNLFADTLADSDLYKPRFHEVAL